MKIPGTFISAHMVDAVKATSQCQLGTQLTLHLDGEYGCMQVSIYFNDADKARTDRLIEAINSAWATVPVPSDQPHYEYQGCER